MTGSNWEKKSFWNAIMGRFSDFFGNLLEEVEDLDVSPEEKLKLAADLMQAALPLNVEPDKQFLESPLQEENDEVLVLNKKSNGMGVNVGPTVLVAHAATIAMQAVFHIQTAILAMNEAFIAGCGSIPADVLAFKLNIYSAARNNLLDSLEQLSAVYGSSDRRFPSVIPPVPQPVDGLSGDELVARADVKAGQAMSETLQANSRLDLAKMKFREYGNGDAASQVQSAKDLLDIACDELKVGIMGSIPEGNSSKSGGNEHKK